VLCDKALHLASIVYCCDYLAAIPHNVFVGQKSIHVAVIVRGYSFNVELIKRARKVGPFVVDNAPTEAGLEDRFRHQLQVAAVVCGFLAGWNLIFWHWSILTISTIRFESIAHLEAESLRVMLYR
jgi:hypothetical protein